MHVLVLKSVTPNSNYGQSKKRPQMSGSVHEHTVHSPGKSLEKTNSNTVSA